MRQYRFRVARVAIVAAAVLGLAAVCLRAGSPRPRRRRPARSGGCRWKTPSGLALENNLSLRVERINPELQDLAIAQARTVWTPNLTARCRRQPDEPDQRLLLGRDRQADQRELLGQRRRESAAAVGRELHRGLGHDADRVQQHLLQPEPVAGRQPELQLHAAAAAQPEGRRARAAAGRQQDEPRDLGHRPAPDGADDRPEREVRLLEPQGGRSPRCRLPSSRSTSPGNRCATTGRRSRSARWRPIDVVEAEAEVARRDGGRDRGRGRGQADRGSAAHAHPRHQGRRLLGACTSI